MHLSDQNNQGRAPRTTPWRAPVAWGRLSLFVSILLAAAAPAARAQTVETLLSTGLFEPYDVAAPGALYYFSDSANNRLAVLNPTSGGVTNLAGLAGNGGAGAQNGSGEQARFYSPQGIVHTTSGLIVADSGNNLIRRVDLNGVVSTLVGDIRYPQLSHANQLPMDNAGTNDGPGVLARINAPSGLALETNKTSILVADTLNGLVRRVSLQGDFAVTTLKVKDQGTPVVARFNRPTAVAVTESGRIFVADAGRHSIYELIEDDHIALRAGSGNAQSSGLNDSSIAAQALFKSPRGLFADDSRREILVSDSGNGVLRRISGLASAPAGDVLSVSTIPGTRDAGLLNPVGIVRDREGVIVFADLDASAIKALRQTQSQPQVSPPQIGSIITNQFACWQLSVVTNATFYNEPLLGMLTEDNTVTYFTSGRTEDAATIPDPSPEVGSAPPDFENCMSSLPVNLLSRVSVRSPRLTIKAISSAANRRPSAIVTANFVFQTANPSIVGADATSITLNTATEGARIYYTFGVDPPDPDPADPRTREYTSGTLNIFDERNDVIIKVLAEKVNYLRSSITSKKYLRAEVLRSIVGVPRNFNAGVGSTIIVPMTLSVAPSNVVRTLQYRVEFAPIGTAKTNAVPIPRLLATQADDFIPLNFPGANLASSASYSVAQRVTNIVVADVTTTNFTTNLARGIAVVFLQTNVNFVVTNQVTLGVLGVDIPRNAREGDQYSIRIVKPTGTSDGIDTEVTLGPGAERVITIKNSKYTVGDVGPATWYNIEEFGTVDHPDSPTIANNDVTLAFRAALGLAVPYRFSDVFDAMDAYPVDQPGQAGGDGQIRYLDWQIILQRALGLDHSMWQRQRDANGNVVPVALAGFPLQPVETLMAKAETPDVSPVVWTREVLLLAGSLEGLDVVQGGTASVPVYVRTRPGASISGMQFTATVSPQASGNNPPVGSVGFQPAPGIPGTSFAIGGAGSVTCAWNLDAFSPNLSGSNLLGHIRFAIPNTAITGQGYVIEFSRADGSPNDHTQYEWETARGYVTVHANSGVARDTISDQWKLHFFGSADAALASPTGDVDGDGASNQAEFIDGTSPIANDLHLRVTHRPNAGNNLTLTWFGSTGVKYAVEALASLQANSWQPTAANSIPGQGGMLQFEQPNGPAPSQFYRVRIVP